MVCLSCKGNSSFQRDILFDFLQLQYSLTEVHITAVCHAADIVANTRIINGVNGIIDLLFQLYTAGILLVKAPGELCGTVPREAAGGFLICHVAHLML